MNIRAAAAQILAPVIRQEASLQSLFDRAASNIEAKDRAWFHTLVYGCLREFEWLNFLSNQLREKKLKAKDSDIKALILLGLYQLEFMRTPNHAAIAETVEAAVKLKKVWAKNLVNAVLRNFLRQREALLIKAAANPTASARCPNWILKQLHVDWPENCSDIIAAMNQQAPLTLRNNRRLQSREQLLDQLSQDGFELQPTSFSLSGLYCADASVLSHASFNRGAFSVQDEAAQLSAELLQLAPGLMVLDACAAPGGKSAHIVEHQPDIAELLALEIDAKRAERISENATRLQLNDKLHYKVADASELNTWWDGRCFDRILLDAPCSASGIIRRHPDIKRLRQADDLIELCRIQLKLLSNLWQCLKPGGILVYATCSIFKQENEHQIQRFLEAQPDAKELTINATWGQARPHGRQLFPQLNGHDGFYYACLHKTA